MIVIAKKAKRKNKFIIMCKIHQSELWELQRNNGIAETFIIMDHGSKSIILWKSKNNYGKHL